MLRNEVLMGEIHDLDESNTMMRNVHTRAEMCEWNPPNICDFPELLIYLVKNNADFHLTNNQEVMKDLSHFIRW